MAAWPEFEFESEYESASDAKYANSQANTTQAPEVKMSMFWNPVTGTYQRCCPALSPVKRQPLVLKSQPQDGIQVAKRQPLKQPLVQPRSVARDQPRKQPQDVAKNVYQPLNSGMKRRPPNGSQDKGRPPRASQCQEQPPAAEIQPPDLPPDPDPSKLQESQNVSSYW